MMTGLSKLMKCIRPVHSVGGLVRVVPGDTITVALLQFQRRVIGGKDKGARERKETKLERTAEK